MDDLCLRLKTAQIQHQHFLTDGRLVEAQRIKQRTNYDIEMMRQMGYCKGIENYARHLSGAKEGEPPECCSIFFPMTF